MIIQNDITFLDATFEEDEWMHEKLQYYFSSTVLQNDSQHCYFDMANATYLVSQVNEGGCSNSSTRKAFRQLISEWTSSCQTKGAKLVNMIKSSTNIGTPKRSLMATKNFHKNVVVNPKLIRGIKNVCFYIDLISIDMMDNDTVSYTLIAEQNNALYMCSKASFTLNTYSTSWKRYCCQQITADDFVLLWDKPVSLNTNEVNNNNNNNTQGIDFTGNGSPIKFGYLTTSSTSRSRTQAITGMDNFLLTVTAGLDENEDFNICTAMEINQKKIKNLSEQVVRMYKQQTQKNDELDEMKHKLRMMERCVNQLKRTSIQTPPVPHSVHIRSHQPIMQHHPIQRPQVPVEVEHELMSEGCSDDFVEINIIPKSGTSPTSSSSFLNIHNASHCTETAHERVASGDYGFPSEDVLTDDENYDSDIYDINDDDTYFEGSSVIFPDTDEASTCSVHSIYPVSTGSTELKVPPQQQQPLKKLATDNKKQNCTISAIVAPTTVETRQIESAIAGLNQEKHLRNVCSQTGVPVIRIDSTFLDHHDDEWEIMENTKSSFTPDKILNPGNEI